MDEKRRRALDAAAILNAPVFTETLEDIQRRAVDAWRGAKTTQEREEAWYLQRAVHTIQREIFNVLQCAAVNAGGKDEVLNTELNKVKERVNGRRKRNAG